MKILFFLLAVLFSIKVISAQESGANNYKINQNNGISVFSSNNEFINSKRIVIYKDFPKLISTYFQKTKSLQNIDTVTNKHFENESYWLNVGLGKNYFGPTLNFSFSYSFDNNIFIVKYLKANEFTFSPGGYDFDEPLLKLEEIGALYGKIYREGYILLSLSGGISYVYGINRGKQIQSKEYEKIKISTLGIPFEANFRIEINSFLGIGASCFGNLNNQKTYLGGMVQIYIGKF